MILINCCSVRYHKFITMMRVFSICLLCISIFLHYLNSNVSKPIYEFNDLLKSCVHGFVNSYICFRSRYGVLLFHKSINIVHFLFVVFPSCISLRYCFICKTLNSAFDILLILQALR